MIDIYLAGPYSHQDPAVRTMRYQELTRAYAELCRAGFTVYSPITHSHVAAEQHGLPTDAQYWARANREFMEHCRTLVVLTMDGWQFSTGVNDESWWMEQFRGRICWVVPTALDEWIHAEQQACAADSAYTLELEGDGFLPSLKGGADA